jgi:hypothetical protein
MTTANIIQEIKTSFGVSNYWLEKFLGVNHNLMRRYAKGLSKARFDDVDSWLNKLNLCLFNDKLFFKTNLNKPISEMPKWLLKTKLNSVLDNIEWQTYGKKEEKENNHIIFWPK